MSFHLDCGFVATGHGEEIEKAILHSRPLETAKALGLTIL
jgi:hypothetical protein